MTFAPATIQETRRLKIKHLDLHPTSHAYPNDLDPDEVGIVGDTAHAQKGTSYHLGKDQLTSTAYSRRTARDKAGLSNAASAEDVGYFKVTTPLGAFDLKHYTAWLFAECRKSAPDTLDLREVIGTVDGKTVLRWDAERGRSSAPKAGEADSSHLTHTHKSWYRDSEFRDGSKAKLDERYLREIGAIQGDDDMGNYCNQGDTNENVRRLQLALNRISDGVTDPKTNKPYAPLTVDAKYGQSTADRLKALLGGTGSNYNAEMDLRMDAALARLAVPPAKDGKDGEDGKDGVVPYGATFVLHAPPAAGS